MGRIYTSTRSASSLGRRSGRRSSSYGCSGRLCFSDVRPPVEQLTGRYAFKGGVSVDYTPFAKYRAQAVAGRNNNCCVYFVATGKRAKHLVRMETQYPIILQKQKGGRLVMTGDIDVGFKPPGPDNSIFVHDASVPTPITPLSCILSRNPSCVRREPCFGRYSSETCRSCIGITALSCHGISGLHEYFAQEWRNGRVA